MKTGVWIVVRLAVGLNVLSGAINAVVIPVGAQEAVEELEREGAEELSSEGGFTSSPLSAVGTLSVGRASPQNLHSSIPTLLSDLEQPATTIADWIAQIEASLVQITEVRVEVTETGLQVILETAGGSLDVPETRSLGNALIADISNAAIAEEFSQAEPIEGIALVSVTSLPGDRVRVAITGTDATPVAEMRSEAQELVLAVTLGHAETVTEEDAIQVVVTGEQEEGYNPSDTSVGTRTDTPLRDIPQSIQVIPQEVLRDQNANNLTEALRNASGVAITLPSENQARPGFAIRGFETTARSSSNFLRDGIRDGGDIVTEIPNIERIEVLRGPASVLYGGANPGGTINLVTEQPLRDPFYAIEATIGNFDFYQGAIDLSGPLNDSRTVLYRLNAVYQDRGSFVDLYERNYFAIAPVVSFEIGDRTRLILEGEYLERSSSLYEGLPAVGTVLPNPNGEIPHDRFLGEPNRNLNISLSRIGYRLEHQFSDNWLLQNAFRARLQRNRPENEFFLNNSGLAADNRTFNRTIANQDTDFDDYDLVTYLTGEFSTGSIGHQLIVGVDLSSSYLFFERFGPSEPAPIDVFNPVYGQPVGPFSFQFDGETLTRSLGIYVQDQVTLAENLKLLLGGRFDLFERSDRFLADETEQTGDAFSPRLGIVYQPIQPISLYASYSRSFDPVTGIAFGGDSFQPERGTQYEVGVKTDVNDRLSATLALYDLTRSNLLTADPVNSGFSIQTGEQRSRGVELNIQGEILPGWNIIAGYAYTDAEITEDNTFPVGNRPPNVPENSFNLWTSYEIQSGDLRGLGLGLGLFYVGERQGDFENSFQLPSYLRTDAAIFYRRDQFRAALNFKNLFDVDYFEATPFGRDFVYLGAPFTVQGTISWQF
jgi:iron complex outermembrane recepter protein